MPFRALELVCCVAFAVVIGFSESGIATNEFPVNLVEIIRLQYTTADDT